MSVVFQEERKVKQGEVVAKFRKMQGIKQEALGKMCPSKFSQQKISELESQWIIDEPTLEELAEALGVTVEFIKNFDDSNAIYNILHNKNTYRESSQDHSQIQHYQPTINYNENKELIVMLEKLIEDDKVKTQAVVDLTKVVSDLAKEVRKLKGK
ncbi:helix-turn-helix domain-containing protein [Sphingobacterium sp. 18053]|uniref:helix-turn-helix domain-containing protein n=1 Tax=Sphingobacterium sp. 18053 TaxID=2681401 RepID=UPI0013577B65|nr:helix-turn-helix transcriptional regulator [Sphingobacterium sp. 18053]